MNDLRNAYIDAKPADTPFALRKAASKAFDAIAARLPAAMRDAVQALKITPGQGFRFAYDEAAPDYFNPATKMSDDQIAAVIPKDLDLDALLGAPAASAMIPQIAPAKTLRDLHAAAIIAGMQAARKGRINTIALEGNPGIGKTTAVRTYLKSRPGGFLFFYISPRVGINNEVFSDIAGPPDTPNGILTITSNSELNRSAKQYAETRPDVYGTERTDRAVKVEGISGLDQIKRHGSLIYVRGESEEDFDQSSRHPNKKRQSRPPKTKSPGAERLALTTDCWNPPYPLHPPRRRQDRHHRSDPNASHPKRRHAHHGKPRQAVPKPGHTRSRHFRAPRLRQTLPGHRRHDRRTRRRRRRRALRPRPGRLARTRIHRTVRRLQPLHRHPDSVPTPRSPPTKSCANISPAKTRRQTRS